MCKCSSKGRNASEIWAWWGELEFHCKELHPAPSTTGWSGTTDITTFQGLRQRGQWQRWTWHAHLSGKGPRPMVYPRWMRLQEMKEKSGNKDVCKPTLPFFKMSALSEGFHKWVFVKTLRPSLFCAMISPVVCWSLWTPSQNVFKCIKQNTRGNQWYWNTVLPSDPLCKVSLKGFWPKGKEHFPPLGITVLHGTRFQSLEPKTRLFIEPESSFLKT